MDKHKLQKKYFVTKRNVLNEMRSNNMTLQELRLFSIYLSKINPMDSNTRVVRFSLADFQDIMELTSRVHITYFKNVIDGLLTKVIGVPDEKGTGMIRFQFFKECRISEDENDEWYIEIDAHDRALPLVFDYKSRYFKYELWNCLRLKSKNQLRMYEVLKQYEYIGHRVISIVDLKNLLGIEMQEYTRFNDFKRDVLEVCRKALTEYTDISFTYEPHGKKGRGGKILELKFTITKNKGYVDPLSLEKFIEMKVEDVADGALGETDTAIFQTKSSAPSSISMVVADKVNTVAKNDGILTEDEHLTNFETFWQAYPEHKRAGKKQAMLTWLDLPRSQELFNEIMTALAAAKKSNKWTTDNGTYVHEPTNWLRDERWLDNYNDTTATSPKKKGRNQQNFKGRKWNYAELERLEREHIDRIVNE